MSKSGRPGKEITWQGVTLTLDDWARVAKLPKGVIRARMRLGWKFGDCIACAIGERPPERILQHRKNMSTAARRRVSLRMLEGGARPGHPRITSS